MLPQPGNHLAESAAAGLLGGLHIHIFLRDREPLGGVIVLEKLQLRRYRWPSFSCSLAETRAQITARVLGGGAEGLGVRVPAGMMFTYY